ncbi:uncharacterized protein LOC142948261 [Anarhichas minor]|uniref:uncharacterized protein LOC142948261 n=1 Tax=Anarhichas minor TaxID=65739 RepID=UPI003F73A347
MILFWSHDRQRPMGKERWRGDNSAVMHCSDSRGRCCFTYRIGRSKSEGKVLLEIQKDLLANFLDQLQEKKEDNSWSHEKDLMQKEICDLKTKLDQAQAKHTRKTDSALGKICPVLRKAKRDLDQQTSETRDLQFQLEQMKADKKGHQKEVDEIKSELRAEKDSVAVVVYNLETIIHYLRVQLKDAAECKARSRALESSLDFTRVQAQMLEKQLSKMEDALHKQKEEAQETLERYQASHEDQLEGKTRKVAVAAGLKKAKRPAGDRRPPLSAGEKLPAGGD